MDLVLASASPRRRELLETTGYAFKVDVAGVEEACTGKGSPAELAMYNAEIKGEAVFRQHPDSLTLGADTVVVLDGKILGKPQDIADAREMLHRLSGRENEVITGLAWFHHTGIEKVAVHTKVVFRNLTADEIDAYVASGEPMDKAGAYGIQGGAAGFVQQVTGSYTNIVGLPLAEVVQHLHRFSELHRYL